MAIRLSQRGWNNVLIFASLFMIILFNTTHDRFVNNSIENSEARLLPEQSLIQNIDFSGVKIERIGGGFRTVSRIVEYKLPNDAQSYVDFWSNSELPVLLEEGAINQFKSAALNGVVIVWLAGESQGRVFQFYRKSNANQAATFAMYDKQQDIWLSFSAQQVAQAIPANLIRI